MKGHTFSQFLLTSSWHITKCSCPLKVSLSYKNTHKPEHRHIWQRFWVQCVRYNFIQHVLTPKSLFFPNTVWNALPLPAIIIWQLWKRNLKPKKPSNSSTSTGTRAVNDRFYPSQLSGVTLRSISHAWSTYRGLFQCLLLSVQQGRSWSCCLSLTLHKSYWNTVTLKHLFNIRSGLDWPMS